MNFGLYYKLNHNLQKFHQVDYKEINNMYPFERDIRIALINADLERELNAGKQYE
jgi:hypothetical protein